MHTDSNMSNKQAAREGEKNKGQKFIHIKDPRNQIKKSISGVLLTPVLDSP